MVERRQASAPAAEGRRKPHSPWRAPHPLVRTVPTCVCRRSASFFFFRSCFVGWAKPTGRRKAPPDDRLRAAHADRRSGDSPRVGTALRALAHPTKLFLPPPFSPRGSIRPSLFDNRIGNWCGCAGTRAATLVTRRRPIAGCSGAMINDSEPLFFAYQIRFRVGDVSFA